jgi:hypothetical protein
MLRARVGVDAGSGVGVTIRSKPGSHTNIYRSAHLAFLGIHCHFMFSDQVFLNMVLI